MKFDMHCHTKEGSMDGKVMIEEYIRTLKRKGFGGMLVSDHDSYDGYREWKNAIKGRAHQDFVVLKGVEYDTCDCGHILVIMPFGVKLKILELRGLPGSILVKIVHAYGGILGPAHPYGEKFMSMISTNERKKKNQQRPSFSRSSILLKFSMRVRARRRTQKRNGWRRNSISPALAEAMRTGWTASEKRIPSCRILSEVRMI